MNPRSNRFKILSAFAFTIINFNFAQAQYNEYQVGQLCSYPFSCDGETRDPDYRQPLQVPQPRATAPVQGKCSEIPLSQSYMARPVNLTCSSRDSFLQVRDRIMHSSEKLDENYSQLRAGNREAAQKALLTQLTMTQKFQFQVFENWYYRVRRGAYTDCRNRGSLYESGGESESYQTTCYRRNRTETVLQRVYQERRYCRVENDPPPPPPPPPPREEPSYGGNSGGNSGSNSGSGSYTPAPARPSPPPVAPNRPPEAPRGNGEDSGSQRDRIRRGFDEGSYKIHTQQNRTVAQNYRLRRIKDDIRPRIQDSEPTYGCREWATRVEIDQMREVTVRLPDVAYSCTRERSRWCTWLEDIPAQQSCPSLKTADVEATFAHDPNWKPGNEKYDDQLPNKFDLLLGESEFVKFSLVSNGTTQSASVQIENAVKNRKLPWNKYTMEAKPSQITCAYQDQKLKVIINTVGRNLQPAPNPLEIPKDENGVETPFVKFDKKGRPALLSLLNPGRSLVLDRSEISRIFGEDVKVVNSKTAKSGAISKKFWENTMFWMRLYLQDGKRQVRISQPVQFNLNQAVPVGDEMQIALDGSSEVRKLYKLSIPFEDLFGFFATDVMLDPKREYSLEVKVAQPGFEGIYETGLKDQKNIQKAADGTAIKIDDKSAYSESKVIKFRPTQASPNLIERWWHWREKRMWRP
ncbi:MAG: hypothetical protein ACK5V3_11545 [Bdellovibrionales bacterium]